VYLVDPEIYKMMKNQSASAGGASANQTSENNTSGDAGPGNEAISN
jgi:hypothetical protein